MMMVMLLEDELLGKVMNLEGGSYIRLLVGNSSRLILIVDFESFRFSKVYKRFGVQKVEEGVFYVVEFTCSMSPVKHVIVHLWLF